MSVQALLSMQALVTTAVSLSNVVEKYCHDTLFNVIRNVVISGCICKEGPNTLYQISQILYTSLSNRSVQIPLYYKFYRLRFITLANCIIFYLRRVFGSNSNRPCQDSCLQLSFSTKFLCYTKTKIEAALSSS